MTQDMLVVQAFMIPELSGSKCRYIQSFLQGLKSNALRLNEISCTDLLQMALLTFTRLVINRAHNINIHLSDTPSHSTLYGWLFLLRVPSLRTNARLRHCILGVDMFVLMELNKIFHNFLHIVIFLLIELYFNNINIISYWYLLYIDI